MTPKRLLFTFILIFQGLWSNAFQLELSNTNGLYGAIDRSNQVNVLNEEFESIGWGNDGLAINGLIRAKKNQRWALYNLKGEPLTAHEFTTLIPHNKNSFIASKRANNTILQQFGLIDRKGKTLVPFDFLRLASTGDLLIATYRNEGRLVQTLFDAKGKPIIQESYKRINPLNDGFFAVQKEDNTFALYDPNGQAITAFEFQELRSLSNAYFLISYFNRLGVINGSGKIVAPPIHRRVFQSSSSLKAEGYPEWTLFTSGVQQTYFFDNIFPLGDSLFVMQADSHVGVIDSDETYQQYLQDHEIINVSMGYASIRNIKTKLFGLLNAQGKQILASNYDSAIVLDHFAFAKIDKPSGQNWFAYNSEGKALNTTGYEQINEIIPGGMVIATKRGKLGLISENGIEQTPFTFESIEFACDNRYIVKSESGYGLIDESGAWLITPYNDLLTYQNDHFSFVQGSAFGINDLDGKQIAKTYERINFLPGGYSKNTHEGYQPYDLEHHLIFENNYDTIYALNENLWYLKRGENQFLYRHEDDFIATLNTSVETIGIFQENYISFKEDGQWGFLDEIGQLRIANRYDSVTAFSEGLAAVKLIGKWGAVDRKEEIIIQPEYDSIGSFYNAMVVVKASGKYGLIDRTGRDVLALKYDHIIRESNWIRLNIGGLVGISDIRGRIIKTPQYDGIQRFGTNHFLVRKGSKFGVVNRNGKDVVPLTFESIKMSPSGFLALKKGKLNTYPLKNP